MRADDRPGPLAGTCDRAGPGTPYRHGGELLRPPAGAAAVTGARILPGDWLRQYSTSDTVRGWPSIDRLIRTLYRLGHVHPATRADAGYAVLDLLDGTGDIVGDYAVPTREAFQYIRHLLGLTVVATDDEPVSSRPAADLSGNARPGDDDDA